MGAPHGSINHTYVGAIERAEQHKWHQCLPKYARTASTQALREHQHILQQPNTPLAVTCTLRLSGNGGGGGNGVGEGDYFSLAKHLFQSSLKCVRGSVAAAAEEERGEEAATPHVS